MIQRTHRLRIYPAHQPIRNVRRITMRRRPLLQLPTAVNDAAVVVPRAPVVGLRELHIVLIRAGDRAGQAVALPRARHAIGDHAQDLLVGARRLGFAVAGVAAMRAFVVLHDAGVAHGSVGGHARGGAHAAFRFLHDHGEDEAVVDARRVGDRLDRVVEGLAFGGAQVGFVVDGVAAARYDVLVYRPQVVEAEPLEAGGPAGGGGPVA